MINSEILVYSQPEIEVNTVREFALEGKMQTRNFAKQEVTGSLPNQVETQ
jgi:hypothetical protein